MFRVRFALPIAFLGLAGVLAIAQNPPTAEPENPAKDFTSLPPKPADVQQQLSGAKVSLLQAIEITQKTINGAAIRSASVDLKATPPTIEVLAYAGGKAHKLVINGDTGAVESNVVVPHLPGVPFEGELTEKESGIKYFDVAAGTGEEVISDASVVQVHAVGYLVDGTEIVNTSKTEPVSLPLKGMFPGFSQGILGMKVGGQRKVVMPPNLAYGEQGSPPSIPGNATLIFDISLLALDPWSKMPTADNLPGEPIQGDMVTTESGLMYYDLHCGEGAQPAGPTAMVKVHYTGYLVNGKKFDSSHDRDQPAQFPLNGVIKGWSEGVSTMKVGGKRKLIIPYKIAYGEFGQQPTIPPQATLIFDIELLETSEGPATPPQPRLPGSPPGTQPDEHEGHDHSHDGHDHDHDHDH